MNTRSLSDFEKTKLISNYKQISDWQEIGPFCVDGRYGEVEFAGDRQSASPLFVQALGGSLLIAVIRYIYEGGKYEDVLKVTISELQSAGFGCGVHRGSHAGDDASDCGFADNLQKIISRLVEKHQDISLLIDTAAPGVRDEIVWANVIGKAKEASGKNLCSGEEMVADCHADSSNLQTLDGEHAEIAAMVNLVEGTTFDTKTIVGDGVQAFNLDLWYVLKQADALNLPADFVTHASLGLYVATEMVLVEDKKQIRLPILINS